MTQNSDLRKYDKMVNLYFVSLVVVASFGLGCYGDTCADLDTGACLLLQKQKPDLCNTTTFDGACRKFCGHCSTGLTCYHCPAAVSDPKACTKTKACAAPLTCVIKSLYTNDGHQGHIMTCDDRKYCDGLGFGFGMGVGRRRRNLSINCCSSNLCNVPNYHPTPPSSTGLPTTIFPVHSCKADIIFVLDESSSVGQVRFLYAVDFIRRIVASLDIGIHGDQVGLLLFDSRAHLQWNLQEYPTKAELLSALNYVPYHNGPTQTDKALKYVTDHMFAYSSGDRSYARNVVILVTGGMSQNHANTVREANRLRAKSSDIIVVGMTTNGIHNTELVNIATDSNHVIEISDVSHMENVILRLLNLIC